ncbi:hypothetical protein A4X13_0g914 [Tilletia indica]|uniref:Uncharacterized protein n=1 Tax=Tilletia indica TaxID=43049 RepID=A0A177TFJ1_9BASI|nr:hypothetical protein A4X13_0g914 [Tilletia indica]
MYTGCGPQDNVNNAERPVIRRKSSVALSSLQERLRSGPRISPPLKIAILTSPAGEFAPPVYGEAFCAVSPTSFSRRRLSLSLGPDLKDKTSGAPLSCYTHFSMRRGSGGSVASISSHGSSPVESSPASSFLNLSSLEQTSGGPRTPSYLGLSPRSGPQDLLPEDPIVDHLPSTEIASRAVSLQHRASISEQSTAKQETAINQKDVRPSLIPQDLPQQIMVQPASPTTRLSAAALAELELESKETRSTSNEHPLTQRTQMAAHLRTRLRPKSSGGDSATSCGTVKAGHRFAKSKAGALRPFAMLKQQSRLSHAADDEDMTDAEIESDAGTDTPAVSPRGNPPQLRNPFELMQQQGGAPSSTMVMPSAPRLQPQHPFDTDGQDAENSGSDSGSSDSSDSEEDEEAKISTDQSHRRRRSAFRRSMPSPLALPEILTDLSLDVSSWRHGEVEMAWRESAKRREERFRKRATICGVVQFEVDHEDGDEGRAMDNKELRTSPATPASVMREVAEASTRLLLEASTSARTAPRPESWSPARFADAGLTTRQIQEFSSQASKNAVQSGSAATGERMIAAIRGEKVVPALPNLPARPAKNKLRAISSLRTPIPIDLKRLQDESEGPVPPGLRSSIEKARKAEALHQQSTDLSAYHPRSSYLPARNSVPAGTTSSMARGAETPTPVDTGRKFFLAGSSPTSPLPPSPCSPSSAIPAGSSGRRVSVSMPVFLPHSGPALLGHGAGGAMLSPAIASAAISAAIAASNNAGQQHHGMGNEGFCPSPTSIATTTTFAAPTARKSSSARRASLAAMRRPPSPPLGTSPVEEPALNSLFAALASAASAPNYGHGWGGAAAAAAAAATAGEFRRRSSVVVVRSRAPSLADVHLNDHARHGFIVDATMGPPPPSS